MSEILTTLFSVLGAIAVLHSTPELEKKYIPTNWRVRLARLFKNNNQPPLTFSELVSRSSDMFDKVFGDNHISLRCIATSSIFTILFTILSILLIPTIWNADSLDTIISVILTGENTNYIIYAILANIFMDYISLYETRYIVKKITMKTKTSVVIFFLILDALLSYSIFIIVFSAFKTFSDFSIIQQFISNYEHASIHHGYNISVTLSDSNGTIINIIKYYLSCIEYSVYSTYIVFTTNLQDYWFSSLYIPQGKLVYVIHASTIWSTTHLSSIAIYAIILLKLFATMRLTNRIEIRRPYVLKKIYDIDPIEYPFSTITINIVIYITIFILLQKIVYATSILQ